MFISRAAQKAWNLTDQGRLDEAREFCADALDRGNEDCMLHYAHGRVLHEFDCHAEARRHVQTALGSTDFPESHREPAEQLLARLDRLLKYGVEAAGLILKARRSVEARKYAEAIRTCETGLAKQPACGPLHVWLGRSLESMEKLPAARDHLALALKDPDLDDEYREIAANRVEQLDYLLRDPPEVAVLLLKAQLATNEKRYADVRLLCRNGLKAHPGAARLRMPMAVALMQLEDYPGAREQLRLLLKDETIGADDILRARANHAYAEEVLTIGPEYQSLLHQAAEALAAGRYEDCRRWCAVGLESHPELGPLRVPFAQALIHLGDVAAAREQLSQALAGKLTRRYQESAQETLIYADELLACGPEVHSFLSRAREALAVRRYDQCLKWCDVGLEMFPRVGWRFTQWCGFALLHGCRFTAAREKFTAALAQVSGRENRSSILQYIAFIDALLRDQPNLDRAEAYSQEAVELTEDNPAAHGTRGVVLIAGGHFDEGAALVRIHLEGCEAETRGLLQSFLAIEEARRGDRHAARIELVSARRADPQCALIEMAESYLGRLEPRKHVGAATEKPRR